MTLDTAPTVSEDAMVLATVEAGGTAPALIAQLRAVAPLIANKRIPSAAPAENVAADNVVDGLVLLRTEGVGGDFAGGQTFDPAFEIHAHGAAAEREGQDRGRQSPFRLRPGGC